MRRRRCRRRCCTCCCCSNCASFVLGSAGVGAVAVATPAPAGSRFAAAASCVVAAAAATPAPADSGCVAAVACCTAAAAAVTAPAAAAAGVAAGVAAATTAAAGAGGGPSATPVAAAPSGATAGSRPCAASSALAAVAAAASVPADAFAAALLAPALKTAGKPATLPAMQQMAIRLVNGREIERGEGRDSEAGGHTLVTLETLIVLASRLVQPRGATACLHWCCFHKWNLWSRLVSHASHQSTAMLSSELVVLLYYPTSTPNLTPTPTNPSRNSLLLLLLTMLNSLLHFPIQTVFIMLLAQQTKATTPAYLSYPAEQIPSSAPICVSHCSQASG